MKLLLGLLLIGASKLSASHDLTFLEAVAAVESGGRDSAIGPCGSRGRYQLKESTWKSLTNWPHSSAHKPLLSQIVALKLLHCLKKELGMEPGQEEYVKLAFAWKAGSGYSKKEETDEQFIARLEYAERVMRIFRELKNKKEKP